MIFSTSSEAKPVMWWWSTNLQSCHQYPKIWRIRIHFNRTII